MRKRPFKWLRFQAQIRRPSYFAMASVFIIGFAHVDRSSNYQPLAKAELLAVTTSQAVEPPQSSVPSPTLSSIEWDFFHPVWEEKSAWKMIPTGTKLEDPVSDPTWSAETLASDPDHRLEKEFQVTSPLKDRVVFWIDVFARYSSQVRVVHDRNDLGLIYGYIDLRPVFRVYGNTGLAESKALRIENKIVKQLKNKIFLAAGHGRVTSSSVTDPDIAQLKQLLAQEGTLTRKQTLDLSERVRTQTGQRDQFLAALQRARTLLPHIESVFKRNGLPASLGRIPFIESSFNVKALSKIGAVGIWQFTPETAREFIHPEEENQWADPLKQTQSATRLLRNYRSVLPDWGTTITSYNSGIGRVRRLLETHRAKSIEQLIELENTTNGLGFAGKNFYAEFLAVTVIEAYKEEIFNHFIAPVDSMLVFKGKSVFPNQACDL